MAANPRKRACKVCRPCYSLGGLFLAAYIIHQSGGHHCANELFDLGVVFFADVFDLGVRGLLADAFDLGVRALLADTFDVGVRILLAEAFDLGVGILLAEAFDLGVVCLASEDIDALAETCAERPQSSSHILARDLLAILESGVLTNVIVTVSVTLSP